MYLPESESFINGIGVESTICSHIIVCIVGSGMGHVNTACVLRNTPMKRV